MSGATRVIWAGVVAQIRSFWVEPANFLGTVLLTPLTTSIFFFLFLQISGRLETLAAYAVVAPGLLSVWGAIILMAGDTIDTERWQGTLEPLVAVPKQALLFSVTGRILATSTLSLLAIVLAVIVGRLIFNAPIVIYKPLYFIGILILMNFALSATGLIMASTFVLARSVRLFQNVLSMPFLLLGGVAFPVSFLPVWLQPLSAVIPLSWGAAGLRGAMTTEPVSWLPFLMLPALTLLYGVIGFTLLARIETRIRMTGAVGAS